MTNGALTQAQIDHFHEQGFVVVEDVLDIEKDIEPVVDEYEVLMDDLCRQWHTEGKLSSTFSGLPFGERLLKVFLETKEFSEIIQHFDIAFSLYMDMRPDTPIHVGPAIFNLLTSRRLLDAIESLIGPEIYCNPIQHIRLKPPEKYIPEDVISPFVVAAEWHQDQGVTLPEADESHMLTVWLPITEATVENGCLKLTPGSHREGLALHCPGTPKRQGGIPEQLIREEEAIPVPVKRGGVLLFHQLMKHGSLSNESDTFRWSFDLRYHPVDEPTGRPVHPGFVARSRSNPDIVLTDRAEWASLWYATRERLTKSTEPILHNRWDGDSPMCA